MKLILSTPARLFDPRQWLPSPGSHNAAMIAYRGHYRDLAPGKYCQFRLLNPEECDRDENRRKAN